MSGRWIEIPAHRVWVVSGADVRANYEFLAEDGGPCREGDIFYRARRKSDGKLYRARREFGAPNGVVVAAVCWDGIVLEEL